HAGGNRHAPPAAAVRPYLLRRPLCGGLLQLHVVGGDGRRRLRRVRGSRRHLRSGDRKTAARRHLFVGRLARPGGSLYRLPRPQTGGRRAAAPARPGRYARGGLKDRRMIRLLRATLTALALLAATAAAQAHPHVWVTAQSELVYAADGTITGVRHSWTFDEMFSTYALQGIETKQKGVYSREELAPLAQTNVESLKEYAF